MKEPEFYRKYKTSYSRAANLRTRDNWWHTLLIILAVVIAEPFIIYKRYRNSIPFSEGFYFQQIKYAIYVAIPIIAYHLWASWREIEKKKRGYCWVGKFKVTGKRFSFTFCYLTLTPGEQNVLRVDRKLFSKIRVGDFVLIRRDAFGKLEEVVKIKKLSSRLAGAGRTFRKVFHLKK